MTNKGNGQNLEFNNCLARNWGYFPHLLPLLIIKIHSYYLPANLSKNTGYLYVDVSLDGQISMGLLFDCWKLMRDDTFRSNLIFLNELTLSVTAWSLLKLWCFWMISYVI